MHNSVSGKFLTKKVNIHKNNKVILHTQKRFLGIFIYEQAVLEENTVPRTLSEARKVVYSVINSKRKVFFSSVKISFSKQHHAPLR